MIYTASFAGSRGEPERGAAGSLPRRAAVGAELGRSRRRTGPWHGTLVSPSLLRSPPRLPQPHPARRPRDGEGGPMPRVTDGPALAPCAGPAPGAATERRKGREGREGREGHRPAGRSLAGRRCGAGGAARGQSRHNAAPLNSPGHRSEGRSLLRGAAGTASFCSGLRRSMNRGGAGAAAIAGLPSCT